MALIRKILYASLAVLLAVVVAEDFAFRHEGLRLRRGGVDCGCVNKAPCQIPCSFCCGQNGMADCFKNPSPTTQPTKPAAVSSGCCARK